MIDYIKIYDKLDDILINIYNSTQYIEYIKAYKNYKNNNQVRLKLLQLNELAETLMKLEKQGDRYTSNYKKLYKEYISLKKEFDFIEEVKNYRIKERELQNFFDFIAENIVKNISNEIEVKKEGQILGDSKKCAVCNCATIGD